MKSLALLAAITLVASPALAADMPVANTNLYQAVSPDAAPVAPAKDSKKPMKKKGKAAAKKAAAPAKKKAAAPKAKKAMEPKAEGGKSDAPKTDAAAQ